MKKKIGVVLGSYFISFVLIFLLDACSYKDYQEKERTLPDKQNNMSGVEESDKEEFKSDKEDIVEESRILVAYFTWAENVIQDDVDVMISASVKSPGNVAQLAQWIGNETGGDLFSIQVMEPYSADWDECLARANEEKADDMHPALSKKIENISEYDIIFLGFPNWWYSCPMAIFSFIDEHDFSGKKVYLFCSHGTGGLAGSVQDISAALPESTVISDNVFHVYQDDTAFAKEDLQSWLSELERE